MKAAEADVAARREGREEDAEVGVMGVEAECCSDGGVYMRRELDRERLDPVDAVDDRDGIPLSGLLTMCDLTSSDAKLRTSTAESFSASVRIPFISDSSRVSLGLLK